MGVRLNAGSTPIPTPRDFLQAFATVSLARYNPKLHISHQAGYHT
jgi:hypothetical protein